MTKILIIDDDEFIGNLEEEILTKEGFSVNRAYSGTEALFVLQNTRPDLVLLDLMLPGLSGEKVFEKIKGIPVIVVSAKVGIDSKVDMLMNGAADYITKPFENRELVARVKVALRNHAGSGNSRGNSDIGRADSDSTVIQKSNNSNNSSCLVYKNLILFTDLFRVFYMPGCSEKRVIEIKSTENDENNVETHLTRTEYAIIKLLMSNQNKVVTKSNMLDEIAADTPDCTESSLKQHVSNLRKKLRDITGEDCIEAVWGIGFKLR